MKLSVIIPTIDRQDNLNILLKSISNSSIIPQEIIVVEQGDCEKTKKNISSYVNLNIRVVGLEEKSSTKARNLGFDKSSGDIIFFFDDDMELSDKYIENAVKYFEENKDVLGVTGSFVNDKPSWSWKRWLGVLFCVYSLKARNIVLSSGSYDYIRGKNLFFAQSVEWMQGGNMVFRRKVFEDGFKFNEDFQRWGYGEDAMITYQISKKFPNSLFYLPELKIYHREGSGGKMMDVSVIKMKILYRYIFWKKEVVGSRWWYVFPFIWSQIGLFFLELYNNFSFKTVFSSFSCYLFLIKNRKKILENKIDYNKYIFFEKRKEFWRWSIGGKFIFVRLKQFLDNPKFIFYYVKRLFCYKYVSHRYVDKYKEFKFLSAADTLDYIIDNKVSLARFSDGDIEQLTGAGEYPPDSDWSQRSSPFLIKRLEEVLRYNGDNILIAHESPDVFLKSRKKSKKEGVVYNMWTDTRMILWKYLSKDQVYGHAHVFIPQHNPSFNWSKLGAFLLNLDVIIVTGGTDQLKNINLGRRTFFVETGKHDAFENYNDIVRKIKFLYSNTDIEKDSSLIMASLGPTADILVFDLSKEDYLVWDTGHMFKFANQQLKNFF